MTRGRKPGGARLMDGLTGSDEAKTRLVMIVEALAGRMTVAEACRQLGLSERRFHIVRNHVLQTALSSLEPRAVGRPAAQPSDADTRVAELEKLVRELRLDLRAAQIREEVALAMPHLLRKPLRSKRAARRTHRRRKATVRNGGRAGCDPSARNGRQHNAVVQRDSGAAGR